MIYLTILTLIHTILNLYLKILTYFHLIWTEKSRNCEFQSRNSDFISCNSERKKEFEKEL